MLRWIRNSGSGFGDLFLHPDDGNNPEDEEEEVWVPGSEDRVQLPTLTYNFR
jgi:hypothetical protein